MKIFVLLVLSTVVLGTSTRYQVPEVLQRSGKHQDNTNRMVKRKITELITSNRRVMNHSDDVAPAPSSVPANDSLSPLPSSRSFDVAADVPSTKRSLLEHLDLSLLSEIISFIGPKQYRFVAAINKSFRTAYLQAFNHETKTHLNASTLEHAKICFDEMNEATCATFPYDLCTSAARYGNLPVLQYLRSVNSEWDDVTWYYAALNGHLHILQWARENDFPYSSCDHDMW